MKKNLLAISLITMSVLYGMLAAVLILLFGIFDLSISLALIISIVVLILQFLFAPVLNDFIFKVFYKMRLDYEIPEYLAVFINEICIKYNMKYPTIGYIDDGSPNAFTYGRTKNDARIVLTRGIFDLLTEEEVKAVVAHELGHATHYDMLFMTVAQLVPLILYYVYEILLEGSSKKSRDNDKGGASALIGLIAYVLYIVSQYVILFLSRTREYYADSFAVEETKNPNALAEALVKIGYGLAVGNKEGKSKVTRGNALGISDAKLSKGVAIMAANEGGVSKENIVNAMKWEKWNIWAKLNELNSTHPLISKRLLAISKRSEEFGQVPYIEFNAEKTESYLDDFLIELLICFAPLLIILGTSIASLVFIENIFAVLGIGGILFTLSLYIQLCRSHKNKDYKETNVAELLGEVKVSNVTSIPCIVEGNIIGRGNPGCIFNEDFVIKDDTGIIFLDYNQPLNIINKVFALFKSSEYFDKKVKIKGWYRRSTVPYIEIYSMEIDGKVKKCHTYTFNKVILAILLVISLYMMYKGFMI